MQSDVKIPETRVTSSRGEGERGWGVNRINHNKIFLILKDFISFLLGEVCLFSRILLCVYKVYLKCFLSFKKNLSIFCEDGFSLYLFLCWEVLVSADIGIVKKSFSRSWSQWFRRYSCCFR